MPGWGVRLFWLAGAIAPTGFEADQSGNEETTSMRAQHARWAWAAVLGLGLAPAATHAQEAASILKSFEPVIKGVDFDTPPTADEIKACKVEHVKGRNGEVIGFAVRDAQGKLLRRFVDTNGKIGKREGESSPTTHLDRWSYYRDGFEIYRESDTDEDGPSTRCAG